VPTLLMLVVAGGFMFVNARSAGEHLLVDRDPGVYLATAGWLAHDGGLVVKTNDAAFGRPPATAVVYESQGFTKGASRDELVPQFLHLFPSLIALADGLFGLGAALSLPAVLGGLALLAVYAWATRLVPPWFALGAVVLLAVSLPQVYFGRDAFSEETTQLFIFAGLWALSATDGASAGLSAGAGDRRVHAIAAGVLFGLAAMTRIDAYVALALLAAWGATVLAFSPRGERWSKPPVWVAAGAAVPAAFGIVDGLVVSRGDYLGDVLNARVIGVAAAAAVVLVIVGFVGARVRGGVQRRRAVLAVAAGGAVVLLGLAAWFVRPAVQTSRSPGRAASLVADEVAVQVGEGLPPDGTRTYNEDTMVWLSWYLGPVALAAGLAGLGFGAVKTLEGRWPPAQVAATLLIGGMTALYIWNPRVAPDQIWAMRRFVPVTVPGLLVLGAVVVHEGWRRIARTIGRAPASVLAILFGAAAAVVPIMTTSAAADTRELRGARAAIEATCGALPPKALVFIPGQGPFAERLAPALRAFCHVDVAIGRAGEGSGDPATALQLATNAATAGRPFVVVAGNPDPFGPDAPASLKPAVVFNGTFERLERTVESVPDQVLREPIAVYVIVVEH
jgi:hypothetical protein